jgi:hypothetical protein
MVVFLRQRECGSHRVQAENPLFAARVVLDGLALTVAHCCLVGGWGWRLHTDGDTHFAELSSATDDWGNAEVAIFLSKALASEPRCGKSTMHVVLHVNPCILIATAAPNSGRDFCDANCERP